MNRITLLGFLCGAVIVSLCGCTMTGRLYPVEGPLLKVSPLPVLEATAHGVRGYSGRMTLTGHDGEKFTGDWTLLAGASVSTLPLFNHYQAEYGVSHSSGSGNPGRAFLVGDRGTTIELEYVTVPGSGAGFGFAKDNRGNVYRVMF